jgi:hypothetical protein
MATGRRITITVQAQVARWLRATALREGKGVSQVVGDLLRRLMLEDATYERAKQDHFEQRPVALRTRGRYPPREYLHDRRS